MISENQKVEEILRYITSDKIEKLDKIKILIDFFESQDLGL